MFGCVGITLFNINSHFLHTINVLLHYLTCYTATPHKVTISVLLNALQFFTNAPFTFYALTLRILSIIFILKLIIPHFSYLQMF
jgi:hypothetical protein